MRAKKTYLLFSFLLLWLFIGNGKLTAQPYLGITVENQDEIDFVAQHLDSLQSLGISYIEVTGDVNSGFLQSLSNYDYTVLLRSDHSFLTIQDVNEHGAEIAEELQKLADQTSLTNNVGGLGLYSNSMSHKAEFNQAFTAVIDQVFPDSSYTLYFVKGSEWYTIEEPSSPFAIFFDDKQSTPNDLQQFHLLFKKALQQESSQILFVEAQWLSEALESYPQLAPALTDFNNSGKWALPLPKPETPARSLNLLVVLLITLWAGLAIQMRYLPYIRPMILRYFFAHRFFVDDILHYRERMITASLLMMFMHAIFGGMIAFISTKILFTEVGISAFFHHLPFLAITGANYFSFFLFAFIVILFTQVIAVLWLHLPAKNLEHISQTLNLYSGVFYLDFVIVTLMLPLFLTETWPALTLTLSSLYVLIWFASFNITAFNASKAMGPNRLVYLMLTIGLHLVIFISILIFLFTNTDVMETISLALSL